MKMVLLKSYILKKNISTAKKFLAQTSQKGLKYSDWNFILYHKQSITNNYEWYLNSFLWYAKHCITDHTHNTKKLSISILNSRNATMRL